MADLKRGMKVRFTQDWSFYKKGDEAFVDEPESDGVITVIPIGSSDFTFVPVNYIERV